MHALSPESRLAVAQRAFAGHIRDPERAPRPAAIPEGRMAVYRELFFNNIVSVLEDALPALRAQYDCAGWADLVRRFFAGHASATPYFHRLPGEFVAWLPGRVPPALAELADYEWTELTLALAPDESFPLACQPGGNLLDGAPVLNPLLRLRAYRHPVHRWRATGFDESPSPLPTRLLLWRDAEEVVRTLELSPMSALLIERLRTAPGQSGREQLTDLGRALDQPGTAALAEAGHRLLRDLRQRGVVVGSIGGDPRGNR